MQILLLSNSTMPGQSYFDWPKNYVKKFLGEENRKLIFIPFAGVTISFDEYYLSLKEVFSNLGYELESIHLKKNKSLAIQNSEGIVIGGGNTFQLIHLLYKYDLIKIIKNCVLKGTPYIGWSAGSNVAGPTIKTTNDMPIVEPKSFKSLDLFPMQINPHYTEKTIEGHGGESRDQRILEFLEVNRKSKVLGLPEGMFIQKVNNEIMLGGIGKAKLFEWDKTPVDLSSGDQINRFIPL